MGRFCKGFHRGEKGLTLIELLIVVGILSILAAVVTPNLLGFLPVAKLAAANTELENVKTASLAYYADNSGWPATSDDLTGYIAGTLKAKYTFDNDATTGRGWVTDATQGTWPATIEWSDGVEGEDGFHGKWIKASS